MWTVVTEQDLEAVERLAGGMAELCPDCGGLWEVQVGRVVRTCCGRQRERLERLLALGRGELEREARAA